MQKTARDFPAAHHIPLFTFILSRTDKLAVNHHNGYQTMNPRLETVRNSGNSSLNSLLKNPNLWLVLFVALLALLAGLPWVLPIGPMYWDTYLYVDASHRIANGQIPNVDFFPPVGPLGYYLYALMERMFPSGQPLLLAQWSCLIVTVPAMALLLADVAPRSRTLAFALLVPFAFFAALPFNTLSLFPNPGVDGFGIYNRHGAQLLYVLAATVLFVRDKTHMTAILSVLTLALFLVKITAFISGGLILAYAVACGLIAVPVILSTAFVFLLVLGLIQLASGLTLTYVTEIFLLASSNSNTLLPNLLTAMSENFSTIVAGGVTVLFLLIGDWREWSKALRAFGSSNSFQRFGSIFDRNWFWLGILLLAGLFFETQNTGSQAFLLIWPGLLMAWNRYGQRPVRSRMVLLVLIAACCFPTTIGVLQKAGRTFATALGSTQVESTNLSTLGLVSTKPIFLDRADIMQHYYAEQIKADEHLARLGQIPSFLLYSEPDFQVMWLQMNDKAIDAIQAYEAENNVHFKTIFTTDFTNIIPALMNRDAPKYVAIGAVAGRTLFEMDARTRKSVEDADLILDTLCPRTPGLIQSFDIYRKALSNHRKIRLTPCFDAYIREAAQDTTDIQLDIRR
tara:strand:+ start:4151 stop:6022 length:1872 start_codon:yes stop_codon:yes gene_type:complete